MALKREIVPLMGVALYSEYEALLERDHLFQDAALDKGERNQLFNDILSTCKWVKIYYLWRPNLTDEADNHIMELAVAGDASMIVTHNTKHLTGGELLFPHIRIVTAGECIRQWREQHGDAYH